MAKALSKKHWLFTETQLDQIESMYGAAIRKNYEGERYNVQTEQQLSSKRKNFLSMTGKGGSVNCSEKCIVLSIGGPLSPGGASIHITDITTGNTTTVTNSQFWGMNTGGNPIAKFGVKFWIFVSGGPGNAHEIREFQLTSNCTVSYIRTIIVAAGGPWELSGCIGLTAKNDNTLIIGTVLEGAYYPGWGNGDWILMEIDISSTTAVLTPLLTTGNTIYDPLVPLGPNNPQIWGGALVGDLVYIPSSNTIVAAINDLTNFCPWCTPPITTYPQKVIHYSYNGTILGQASLPTGVTNPYSMFCYGGQVFCNVSGGPPQLFDLTNYTLSPASFSMQNANDQASDPHCCDGSGTSTGCYDIGDIGPEGGIIFSIPGLGLNTSTDTYYEVAQDDIAIGGTPNAGFNLNCGDGITTYPQSYTVSIPPTPQSQINNFSFTYAYGGGIPLPNMGDTVTGNVLQPSVLTWTITAVNIVSPGNVEITLDNPITIAINMSTGLSQSFQVTIHPQPIVASTPGWSLTGAEWGAYNKPNIITSTDFGTGSKNTDTIDAYPSSLGIHPWLPTHSIAATLCKQHGFTNDWFLPSKDEFTEMFTNAQYYLGLNPLGQNSEHIYWTSSQWRQDPNNPIPNPDKYSWAVKSNGVPDLAYRCHVLSVRPIRKFECIPTTGY